MKQLLKISATPATALFALAYLAMATPAAAGPSEYCRQDVTSGMRSCSFETLETEAPDFQTRDTLEEAG